MRWGCRGAASSFVKLPEPSRMADRAAVTIASRLPARIRPGFTAGRPPNHSYLAPPVSSLFDPRRMTDKRFFPRQVVESGGNRWDWALLPLVLGLLVLLAYG